MCKKIWTSLSRTSTVGTISLFCVFATLKRNCFLPTSLFLFIYAIARNEQFSTIVITNAINVIPLLSFFFICIFSYFIIYFSNFYFANPESSNIEYPSSTPLDSNTSSNSRFDVYVLPLYVIPVNDIHPLKA